MTTKEKKEWAKLIYLKDNLTQKEISKKVGISEQTLCKWIKVENWEMLKTSIVITKEEELKRFYDQVKEINNNIRSRKEGERHATNSEADILSKLSSAIRKMETDIGLPDVIEVCKRIVNYVRPLDIEQAKNITKVFDSFIQDALKK